MRSRTISPPRSSPPGLRRPAGSHRKAWRSADRYVTVKGSPEKIVDADLVDWPQIRKLCVVTTVEYFLRD